MKQTATRTFSPIQDTPPISLRPMTKQEREAGAFLPHGLVDRESIEARSLTVSTKCPHCGVELVSHVMGSLALRCPR